MHVIKLGGSLLEDAKRRGDALRDIAAAWNGGEQLVLVHGGGRHIDAMLAKLGIPKRTHAGLRITDDATLDVVVSVLGGLVNKMLVSELAAFGVRAGGISGSDGGILVADRHPAIDGVEFGNVGRIAATNPLMIRSLLMCSILPVVSSLAQSREGKLLNVNADSAAASLAVALRAERLRFITDVAGLLDASGNVVPRLHARTAEEFLGSSVVSGGMRPKLEAALHALRSGVHTIAIGEEGGTVLVAA